MSASLPVEETSRTALTADVVAAYVANNSVAAGDLPQLIASVHQTFSALLSPPPPEAEKPIPAVPIRKSITPDYLISLEDGKSYKSMKRHLTSRGITPQQYREKWGLPRDFPMVSPNYAAARSELALKSGLGTKGPAARKARGGSKKGGSKKGD